MIRTAHESFICGVCADEVEIGDEFRGFECAECGSGGAAHVFPCTKKGAICWACKDKKEIPIRKKRKVALS